MPFTPSPEYLRTIALLESGNNPLAKNPKSSAKGRYQFIDDTAAAYGITAPLGTPEYEQQEDAAILRFTADNHKALKKALGREPTNDELYLAHQQGPQGAIDLIKNPSANASDLLGTDEIALNGGDLIMSSDTFRSKWRDKYAAALSQAQDPEGFGENDASAPDEFGLDDFGSDPAAAAAPAKEDDFWSFENLAEIGDTLSRQAGQGASFGYLDEGTDAILSGIASAVTGQPYKEIYADARKMTREAMEKDYAEHPVASIAGNVGGAVLTGKAVADGLVKAGASSLPAVQRATDFAARNPKTAAALLGAGGNVVYSSGTREGTLPERLDNAGGDAILGGVLGPLGYGVVRGAQKAGSALSERYGPVIAGTLDRIRPAQVSSPEIPDDLIAAGGGEINPMTLAGIADENALATLENGKVIPMTRGDRSQNVVLQRQEQIAAESGSAPMLAARAQQQDAARRPFLGTLGPDASTDPLDLRVLEQAEAERAAGIVRNQYDDLSSRVNDAYGTARTAGGGVSIRSGNVSDDFLGGVDRYLQSEFYKPGSIPQLDKALGDLRGIVGTGEDAGKVTAVKLNALEAWKKQLNRDVIGELGNNPAKERIAKQVSRQYDDFLTNLGEDAIINGDDTAIKAFKDARSLAKEKFDFYESDRAVSRILDNRDLSGEQLVNVIYGAEKLAGKGDDGRLIETMLRHAGERAPEMQDALKRGIMAKTLRRSVTSTADPTDPTRNLVSFGSMRNEVGNLMSKKELFESVFDPQEQQFMRQLYDDLGLVASKQKGAVNNSSTGILTADMISGLGKVLNNPLFRSTPGLGAATNTIDQAFQRQAAAIATGRAEKGLDEFILEQINNIDAKPAYYGSIVGNNLGNAGLSITVGPDDWKEVE